MISIDTKRLHLRNVSQNDAHVIFDYRNNEICARYQRGQAKDFEKNLNLIERRKMMKLGYKDLGYVPCFRYYRKCSCFSFAYRIKYIGRNLFFIIYKSPKVKKR